MTVESELTRKSFGGLRTTTEARVVDYRQVRKGNTSTPQQNRLMLLERHGLTAGRFAEAISEDMVRRYSVDLAAGGAHTDEDILTGPQITDASLVRYDGLERWAWRETREGDYPELDGEIISSIGEVDNKDLLMSEGIVELLTREGRVIAALPVSISSKDPDSDVWKQEAMIVIPPPGTTFGDGLWVVDGGAVFFNQRGEFIDTAYFISVETDEAERLIAERDRVLKTLGRNESAYRAIRDDDVEGKSSGRHHVNPQIFSQAS